VKNQNVLRKSINKTYIVFKGVDGWTGGVKKCNFVQNGEMILHAILGLADLSAVADLSSDRLKNTV
jgi:hypothetical protein